MKNTIQIQNLKCGGCANTIITQLSKLDGVSEIEVNNDTKEVSFINSTETEFEAVKNKLSDLGYPIKGAVNSLPKKAKSFVSCAIGRINS